MRFADGHVGWFVTGYSAVRSILSDARFSARPERHHLVVELPMAKAFAGRLTLSVSGMFHLQDPPQHTRYRRVLTGEFTVQRMKRLEPKITDITRASLDAMEKSGPPADLVEDFAFPIPSLVTCELLGIAQEDREGFRWAVATMSRWDSGVEETRNALDTVLGFFPPLIRRKRREPGDDLLSRLIENSDLTDEELATVGYILFAGGFETTANMLALGSFALLEHPAEKELLRAEPGLINNAVEELLRYLTIGHVGPQRAALEDVEIEGVLIKKGQAVMMSLPAANRDPGQFEDPESFGIAKPAGGHVAFGHGVHGCLGQQLARVVMRLAYPALFDRFPGLRLAVPPGEVPIKEDAMAYGVHRLPVEW
ncbi:cytochrome P450 [Actinomadura sp. DC4]|uniref:cytochrome P450 n=1 Tax=Actinomadura sp. DC4 TaxID=3055069 RepID=UPI0025B05E3C|nr:cytochrome P450 [Actinomadura sp. DC4]MDN3355679.1 cytochrome P450 [Actinomadura sp. DC4]